VPEQVEPSEEKTIQGEVKINNLSYQKMEGEEWESKGRLVGHAIGAPLPYKVEILGSNGRVVALTELFVKSAVYEIWLLPGTYARDVKADEHLK
jgi:hypothetical protein